MAHARAAEPDLKPLILIADPYEDSRKLYCAVLADAASELAEAEDGAEALAKAVSRRPGLVVTDARLPRIDGVMLCSLLRQDPATHDTVVLIVAASMSALDVQRARLAGANDVIVKPASPETLRTKVAELLRPREARGSAVCSSSGVLPQLVHSGDGHPVEWSKRRMSRSYLRERTTAPPTPPPVLRCPECDRLLVYTHSQLGGVNKKFAEQWDYFECPSCGEFQYRHRTRKLRAV